MAQAKNKPDQSKAVVVRKPQSLQPLPERMAELRAQKHLIEMVEEIYATLMVEGVDYGNPIGPNGKPIFPKPMLYKAGAELLRLYLGLQLKTTVDDSKSDFSIPIIRFRVTTDIYDRKGNFLGSGEGVCSSLESKYRYRWLTINQLPTNMKAGMVKTITKDGKEVEVLDHQKWIDTYGVGSARWTQFGVQVRVDNPEIFDLENTILSQAKKRSLADGIKTVTGASRIFLIGQEEIRAASLQVEPTEVIEGEVIPTEGIPVEIVEEPEETAEVTAKEQELRAFQEELKSWMIKAKFTTPDGKLDLPRFKKLLKDTYSVENIGQLDKEGRKKLLNQMADFAAKITG